MSYVIQHFYQPTRDIGFNPRVKLLIICKNITKMFLFFRFNFNLFSLNFALTTLSLNQLILYQSQFLKYITSFDSIFMLKLTANHTTKFHKSLVLYGLKTFYHFFLNFQYSLFILPLNFFWFCNFHYFTIKIIKFPIFKKFYKNVFLFFLLASPFQWQAHTNQIKFYNMFFFFFFYLKANKFYNQKFFKIFNV